MSRDAILVLECLFGSIWRLFTSWHIPGTNVTPAAAFLFFCCVSIGLKFVGRMTGIGVSLEEVATVPLSVKDRLKPAAPEPELPKAFSSSMWLK